MSDKELNSYRFMSGEDPSDEMLDIIMKEVAQEASDKRKKAQEKLYLGTQEEWGKLKKSYEALIKKVIHSKLDNEA